MAKKMKRLLQLIIGLFGISHAQAALPPIPRVSFFVFAKIQDTVKPIERGAKYEDPLDEALKKQHLGEVTGGGTMQKKDGAIEWIGVDIQLVDLSEALTFTKQKLRELGAPKGSVLEFKRDGKDVVEPIHER